MAQAIINVPNVAAPIPNGSVVTASLSGSTVATHSTLSTADPVVGRVYITAIEPLALPDGTPLPNTIDLPFAPNEVTIEGLGHQYQEVARPGRKPLLRYQSEALVKVSFSAVVTGARNGSLKCEQVLEIMAGLNVSGVDLLLVGMGGIPSRTRFRMTDFSVRSVRQNPADQSIAIANVDFTFTESTVSETPIPGMIRIKDVPMPAKNIGEGQRNDNRDGETSPWPPARTAGDAASSKYRTNPRTKSGGTGVRVR